MRTHKNSKSETYPKYLQTQLNKHDDNNKCVKYCSVVSYVARDDVSRLAYERRKKHQLKHGGGIYCTVISHSWQESLSLFLSFFLSLLLSLTLFSLIHPGRVNVQQPNDKLPIMATCRLGAE